ncbi:MAG: lysophospholipid acyltransferase family protein [Kangiellaceae bacterium]|jgi:1-acyl-sn-glycerol-3-phosphate acyltransferase
MNTNKTQESTQTNSVDFNPNQMTHQSNLSQMRKKKASLIRFYWIASITGLVTLISCLRIILASWLGRLSITDVDRRMKWWASQLLGLVRVKTHVVGVENMPTKGRRVIVMCNHSSLYDIPVAISALDTSFRFVAKKELFNIPIFGSALKRGGFLSIDRNNREQAVKDLQRAKEQMLNGITLWMSPEGTRSKDGKLAEFKRGGFHIAIETKALIVPVVIKDIHKLQAGDNLDLYLNQSIEVEICKPIDAAEFSLENRRALINQVRAIMLDALGQKE